MTHLPFLPDDPSAVYSAGQRQRLYPHNDYILDPGSTYESLPGSRGHYYAISLHLGEHDTTTPRTQYPHRYPPSTVTSSSSRFHSHYAPSQPSTVFDYEDLHSVTSASTAPPTHGPEPAHLHRAMVPIDLDTLPTPLPCEFIGFARCDMSFPLAAIDAWVQHIMREHLNSFLPMTSICWFCDDFKFPARSSSHNDRYVAYRERMQHIAMHFADNTTVDEMRPDFGFVQHLRDHNLITEKQYKIAMSWSEMPVSSKIEINTISDRRVPWGSVTVDRHEERRERRRRQRNL